MMFRHSTLPLAAVLLLAGCDAGKFDAASEQQKIMQRDAEWSEAASAGKDVEEALSYWSDDAVIVPQGQPIVEGKAAIRAFVTNSFNTPGFSIHWRSEKPAFSPDGKLAYLRSFNSITMRGTDGTSLVLPGRGVTVWRKEPDGLWRCVVDIWNDPPSAATLAAPVGPGRPSSDATN
jgi:ketosteroid isomerase-like protein